MTFKQFNIVMRSILKSQHLKLSTLGRESFFEAYQDERGNIILRNSTDIKSDICCKECIKDCTNCFLLNGQQNLKNRKNKKVTKSDFDAIKTCFMSLKGEDRFKGVNYSIGKNLKTGMGFQHAPLLPAVFRFLCEQNYFVCDECDDCILMDKGICKK
ncbi:MAG: hypothetical protein E7035_04570 [Verrucomicrobiaceae bacterium]|nr:hypothetical protein [Verrucomicrobiaceae bacterium]